MFNKKGKRSFADYEKEVKEKKKGKSTAGVVPSIITIQRMSLNKNKRKYEPEAVRENVDFSEYSEVSIKNIKLACEKAYNAPNGTCDVLVTASGPSAIEEWQIQKKQFYLIHFKHATKIDDEQPGPSSARQASPVDMQPRKPEKSVSIVDILRASKLKKPVRRTLHKVALERYIVANGGSWEVLEEVEVHLEVELVDDGGFRECFAAFINGEKWMLKRLKKHRVEEAKDINLSDEDHSRKQVQMHMVAKSLIKMFNEECPPEFGEKFSYNDIFYCDIDGPATLERFIDGPCMKYINNTGMCPNPENGKEDLFEKAQALAHYTWRKSGKKLLLLDIQGSEYNLYDPEIATPTLITEETDTEATDLIDFCMGNMSLGAIKLFIEKEHKCKKWCEMVGISQDND